MEGYSYNNTGKRVKDLRTQKVGIILRENLTTGQIQVLEKIQPYVITTYDSFTYLKFIDEEN
jgi:hypothetical protein